ncbi:MAG: hypothetical protein NVS2B8_18420 [Vulcanimicrobiaceae bacterium]
MPAASDRRARRALLARLARDAHDDSSVALRAAYREEDTEGRCLALRALGRSRIDDASHAVFLEALRVGSDDERSIAVDAIARAGDREALVATLRDRIEAIAARAALAYVDSTDRGAYYAKLAPHVDRVRLETILTLLAGIVE